MRVLCSLLLTLTCLAVTEAAEPIASIGGQGPPRAARSVHLGWMAPETAAFTVEMTIEQTTAGSYFMACGWGGGYFGLQEIRDGRKVAIFSVWDPVKGDDPKLVRPEDRVELLHADPEARIKRFGGEGTGGQCMIDFPWEVGQPVRLLGLAAGPPHGQVAPPGHLPHPERRPAAPGNVLVRRGLPPRRTQRG